MVNVSNQILMLIYQKLKTNIQVKEEKHRKRQKKLKDTFYLIFLTLTLTLRQFKLSKFFKKHTPKT
jgi:accessory gene regulator protein AgrB